jgi:hypothetical protein
MSRYLSQIAARSAGAAASNALIPASVAPPASAGPEQGIGAAWGPVDPESAPFGTITEPTSNMPIQSHPDPESSFRPASREPITTEVPYFSRYAARADVPDETGITRPIRSNPPEVNFESPGETPEIEFRSLENPDETEFRYREKAPEINSIGPEPAQADSLLPARQLTEVNPAAKLPPALQHVQPTNKEMPETGSTHTPKPPQVPDAPRMEFPPRLVPQTETKQKPFPETPERPFAQAPTLPHQAVSILRPANTPLQEFRPKPAPPKLVIGRITVEVMPPASPAEKAPVRPVQKDSGRKASTKTGGQQVYKLSFGLGQL